MICAAQVRIDTAWGDRAARRLHFTCRRRSVATGSYRHAGEVHGSWQRLCRLSVRMKRLGSFSVESIEKETPNAVSRAVNRAAKQVQRILDRQRDGA